MSSDHLVGAALSLGILALGALARWISSATRREGAADVVATATTTALARMELKLDALMASIAEVREARVRLETEHDSTVERLARAEARLDALDARITRVDDARHDLGNTLHARLNAMGAPPAPPAKAP